MNDTVTEWKKIVAASKPTPKPGAPEQQNDQRRIWEGIVASSKAKSSEEPSTGEQIYNLFRHPFTPAPGLKKVERLIAGPMEIEDEPSFVRDVIGKTARQFAAGALPTTTAGALTFGLSGPALRGLQRLFPALSRPVGELFGKVTETEKVPLPLVGATEIEKASGPPAGAGVTYSPETGIRTIAYPEAIEVPKATPRHIVTKTGKMIEVIPQPTLPQLAGQARRPSVELGRTGAYFLPGEGPTVEQIIKPGFLQTAEERISGKAPITSAERRLEMRAPSPIIREQTRRIPAVPSPGSQAASQDIADYLKEVHLGPTRLGKHLKGPAPLFETFPLHRGAGSTDSVVPLPSPGLTASVPPGAGLPPLDPVKAARVQTWRQYASQAWQRLKDQLPGELPLIKRVPNSPVISDVERMGVQAGTRLDRLIKDPLTDELWKYTPDQWFAHEAQAVRIWEQGGRTPQAYAAAVQSLPPAFQHMLARRTAGMAGDQAARVAMDLGELPEVSGPYFARLTDRDAREVFDVFGQGSGLAKDLQTTVKSFQKSRVYGTAVEGMGQGVIYEDPRKAWLIREWMSIKLQETAALGQQLIGKVLFADKNAAQAASSTGTVWPIDGLPWKSGAPNHRWWATSREEALFLQQNLSRSEGRLGVAMHWANQAFRNPNLINPLPHVVKNMWVKYAMARGSLNPAPLLADAREYVQHGNPSLIQQFRQVMPFTEHGETTHQLLMNAVGSPTTKALSVIGQLNKLSSKFIFAYADPAMRYSLWKWYVGKGLTPQEAANNVWVDLIRYGTRSELVDTWKSIPMNFFVPWRVGSWTAIVKNLSGSHAPSRLMTGAAAKGLTFALSPVMRPVRTGMIIGAVELAREAYFRDTGRTFHIPFDYVDGPMTKIVDDPKQGAYVAATMLLLGPGGEAAAKNIADSLNAIRGKPEWDKVKQLYWGIAQAYNMSKDLSNAILNGDTHAMIEALKIAALAEHDTYGYTPDHLAKYLPEWLPAMEKARLVKEAETRRAAIKAIGEQKAIQRQRIREATLPPSQRP